MATNYYFKEGNCKNSRGHWYSVARMTLPVVQGYVATDDGGYVTVDATKLKHFTDKVTKVFVKSEESFIPSDKPNVTEPAKPQQQQSGETDREIKDRMRQRFNMLHDITAAAKRGDIRAVIVSGPPGIGKSYGVEQELNKHNIFSMIKNEKPKYEIVKGAMSAFGLYMKLYEYKDKGNVIVFDDCDSVLLDDTSLNILKAALDTSRQRFISWNTENRTLKELNIPNKFEFQASAMFISNIKFDHIKSKKLSDHLVALESRCHYIDLAINTEREKVLRIKQLVEDGMLRDYNLKDKDIERIIAFIDDHKKELRELSIRTVVKLADLKKSFGDNFESYAKVTLLKSKNH